VQKEPALADGINQLLNYFWEPGYWTAPGYILAALIHVFLLLNVVAVGTAVYIWLERKVSGRIQDRFGPTRVGGKFGWLQVAADGIKLIAKEDVMPAAADPLLFRISPYLSLAASLTAFLALPFATGWVALHVNVAVFFVLAVLGLEVFGVILAGYASGSKWSLFGGMREAAQVVSYEVPLGLCVLIPVMIAGTMDLTTIANMQSGWFTNWLILHDPATFVVFWVYFTCAMASVNRAPFDLAEAESELVAGFHTEYSGMRWSIFFMAEYGSMFVVSALAAILFFGGWHGPIPIMEWASYGAADTEWNFLGYLANLAGCANLLLKATIGVVFMIWMRWTLPRLRIDQVITMCWKYCVPIAALGFLVVLGWQYFGLWSPNDLAPNPIRSEIRESWVETGATSNDVGSLSANGGREARGSAAIKLDTKENGGLSRNQNDLGSRESTAGLTAPVRRNAIRPFMEGA
jgi:NADH-quinone oxidoreductase subunit H